MNSNFQFENSASRSQGKHEGESSSSLCDRLSRTRDFSQRQLPTDQDYAVSTREYQTDQSSQLPAPAAAGPVLEQRQKQRQRQKPPHQCAEVDGSLHIRAFLAGSYSRVPQVPLLGPGKPRTPSAKRARLGGQSYAAFFTCTVTRSPAAESMLTSISSPKTSILPRIRLEMRG